MFVYTHTYILVCIQHKHTCRQRIKLCTYVCTYLHMHRSMCRYMCIRIPSCMCPSAYISSDMCCISVYIVVCGKAKALTQTFGCAYIPVHRPWCEQETAHRTCSFCDSCSLSFVAKARRPSVAFAPACQNWFSKRNRDPRDLIGGGSYCARLVYLILPPAL